MQAEILRVTGVDFLAATRDELAALLDDRVHPDASWAQVVQAVYSKLVEPTLNQPTLVYDFPLESFPDHQGPFRATRAWPSTSTR